MPLEKRSHRVWVGLAVATIACATTFAVNRIVTAPFILFFPAVFAGAWWGDRIGGWIVTVAATASTALLVADPDRILVLAVFVPSAGLLVHAVARLHEAVAARETLVQVVSHDLKSPLTSILLQEQILGRQARDRDLNRDEVQAHIVKIEHQLEAILGLINDLLDAAQLSARRLRLRREKVDLCKMIDAVVERFRPQIEQGGYALRVEQTGDTNGSWDPARIEQVIANLLSNAIKYGDGKPISVAAEGDGSSVRLRISDGGRGMGSEQMRTIFNRFERGGELGRAAGHGLGLWIVRALVEAHGGRVSVESEVGRGTLFAVELPREAS